MLLDKPAELCTISFCFSCADTWNVLQFVERMGINGCHRFQRSILENDVRRHIQVFAHALSQVFQHLIEQRINCACLPTLQGDVGLGILIIPVFDYLERTWIFQKIHTFVCDLQNAIVVYVFFEVSGNDCLSDNNVPYLIAHIVATSKFFYLIMFVRTNLICCTPDQYVF